MRSPTPGAAGKKPSAVPEIVAEIECLLNELVLVAQAPRFTAGLTLTPMEVDELAVRLGLASTVTAASLLTAIDRLASLKIGDIRIPFTPGQLAELQHRATKRGRTVEMEMRAVVARIEDELFYKGGG